MVHCYSNRQLSSGVHVRIFGCIFYVSFRFGSLDLPHGFYEKSQMTKQDFVAPLDGAAAEEARSGIGPAPDSDRHGR